MSTAAATDRKAIMRDKRAQGIAAMGLVTRDGDRFSVATPSLRGRTAKYEVWRDEGELPEASLWREEIANAVERSDVFLLAVSRQSLKSREVRLEFEHARNLHKRIVPVAVDGVSPGEAPPDLADINWIHLNGERFLERIDRAIKTDLHHLQQQM